MASTRLLAAAWPRRFGEGFRISFNISPLLLGKKPGEPIRNSMVHVNYGSYTLAIREGDWKLIHWFGDYLDTTGFTPDDKPYGKLIVGPRSELYYLGDDLGESNNLAADRPKKTAHLTKTLNAWLKRTGAGLPTRNPDFDEARWWTSDERK